MAFMRNMAMTLVRSDTESKSSLKRKLKNLAWSDDYLEKLHFRSIFAGNSPPQAQELPPVKGILCALALTFLIEGDEVECLL